MISKLSSQKPMQNKASQILILTNTWSTNVSLQLVSEIVDLPTFVAMKNFSQKFFLWQATREYNVHAVKLDSSLAQEPCSRSGGWLGGFGVYLSHGWWLRIACKQILVETQTAVERWYCWSVEAWERRLDSDDWLTERLTVRHGALGCEAWPVSERVIVQCLSEMLEWLWWLLASDPGWVVRTTESDPPVCDRVVWLSGSRLSSERDLPSASSVLVDWVQCLAVS